MLTCFTMRCCPDPTGSVTSRPASVPYSENVCILKRLAPRVAEKGSWMCVTTARMGFPKVK